MTVNILSESLNGYCEKPTRRLGGSYFADLYAMAEVESMTSQPVTISAKDIELSIKNDEGRLILVQAANQVNDQECITIAPEAVRSLKIKFVIADAQQLMLSNSGGTSLRLTIESNFAIVSDWVEVEF
ncbi:MAG: hypothetical protein R3C14_17970 [Caldilineaceae bacterium]